MHITLNIPDRIGREAERLAREEGIAPADFCARAVEAHVKAASQQRAIDQINALLEAPEMDPRLLRERRA